MTKRMKPATLSLRTLIRKKIDEMIKEGYIYFLSNQHNNVLYLGVTNNLRRRIAEHKGKINKGFTYKYNCDKLVYFETIVSITDAIRREKQLKNWKREWKNELINGMNPTWRDLSEEIGVDDEWIKSVKAYYEIADQVRNDVKDQVRNDVKDEVCNDVKDQVRNVVIADPDPQSPIKNKNKVKVNDTKRKT